MTKRHSHRPLFGFRDSDFFRHSSFVILFTPPLLTYLPPIVPSVRQATWADRRIHSSHALHRVLAQSKASRQNSEARARCAKVSIALFRLVSRSRSLDRHR